MTEDELAPDWQKEKRNYLTGWKMWTNRVYQKELNKAEAKKYYRQYEYKD